jgi:hypothetical protein
VNARSGLGHARYSAASFLALPALPQPPQPEPAPRLDAFTIALIIVVVLGIVSLLALATRPLVAQRLGGSRRGIAEPIQPERLERERPPVQAPGGEVAVSPTEAPLVRPETIAAIAATITRLLTAANTGDYRTGLSLYTRAFRQRSAAQAGMTEAEFEAALASAPPPPPEEWLSLQAIDSVELLPDGRIAVVAFYQKATGAPPSPERYIFVEDQPGRWLIDDIAPATA